MLDGASIRNGRLRARCPVHGGEDDNLDATYKDGKLMATCFSRGCDFRDIMREIRARLGDEPDPPRVTEKARSNGQRTRVKKKRRVVGTKEWEIRDARGELIARHVRTDYEGGGKSFGWRLPDGTWKLDRKSEDLPLYGAEEAAKLPEGSLVVVTEGEKACDALRDAGINAVGTVTCSATAPGKTALSVLRGKEVVLWPDNDESGRAHMERVAERLEGLARATRLFAWEDAPEKGDAADHPKLAGLLEALTHAPLWKKPPIIGGYFSIFEAIRDHVEPPTVLLPDMLLAGKAHNFYAPGGVGKTWLLIWMAVELMKRGKKVAILDLENSGRTYAERFEEMAGLRPEWERLLLYYAFPENLDAERYARWLDAERPDVVMFDSWIGFLAADGLDENVSNDISTWAERYSKPALRRGCAIVLLDHVPHEHERERGSSRKRDEMDVVWKLTKVGNFDRENTAMLHLTRMKDREGWLPEKLAFEIGGDEGQFVMRRDDKLARVEVTHLSRAERSVLEALKEGASMKAEQWRRAAGQAGFESSKTALYRIIDSLTEKGKVRKTEGLYERVDHSTEAQDVVVQGWTGPQADQTDQRADYSAPTQDVVVRFGPGPFLDQTDQRGSAAFGPFGPPPLRGGGTKPGPNAASEDHAVGGGPGGPQDVPGVSEMPIERRRRIWRERMKRASD